MPQTCATDLLLDWESALQRFGGDPGALKQSVEDFLEYHPEQLREIRAAIARGDAKALERAAYRLDWDLSRLSARAAFEAALRLERMGREGDLTGAAEAFETLRREIEDLKGVLRQLES